MLIQDKINKDDCEKPKNILLRLVKLLCFKFTLRNAFLCRVVSATNLIHKFICPLPLLFQF